MATALLPLEQTCDTTRFPRSLWYMGSLMTFHADSADTDGQFALIEVKGQSGGEPPRHVHTNEDELFYVMEGRLKVFRGGETIALGPGESVFLPRNVPHTFKIVSDDVRALVYITPGGFEEYFRELGQPATTLEPREVATRPDIQTIMRVAGRFGITFLP